MESDSGRSGDGDGRVLKEEKKSDDETHHHKETIVEVYHKLFISAVFRF